MTAVLTHGATIARPEYNDWEIPVSLVDDYGEPLDVTSATMVMQLWSIRPSELQVTSSDWNPTDAVNGEGYFEFPRADTPEPGMYRVVVQVTIAGDLDTRLVGHLKVTPGSGPNPTPPTPGGTYLTVYGTPAEGKAPLYDEIDERAEWGDVATDLDITTAVAAEATARSSAVTAEATTRAAADTALTAALATEATTARNADNLTSGTVAAARIASSIARDTEVADAVAAALATAQAYTDAREAAIRGGLAPADLDAILEIATRLQAGESDIDALLSAVTGKQDADATLAALAGTTIAADKLPYGTGPDSFGTTDFVAFARSMLALADADAWLDALGASAAVDSIRWQNAWAALTTYNEADTVPHAGRTWRALRTSTGVTPVAGADWELVAEKGTDATSLLVGPATITANFSTTTASLGSPEDVTGLSIAPATTSPILIVVKGVAQIQASASTTGGQYTASIQVVDDLGAIVGWQTFGNYIVNTAQRIFANIDIEAAVTPASTARTYKVRCYLSNTAQFLTLLLNGSTAQTGNGARIYARTP